MNSVKGLPELLNRLEAIQRAPQPIVRKWADNSVSEMRSRVRKRTGKTARSFRHGPITNNGTTITGSEVANFIDAGTRAHDETASGRAMRFRSGQGRTVFARKVHHPRTQARPFKRKAMEEGLRKTQFDRIVIAEWNRGA